MPIHDWTRVDAGIFHHFHQRWIGALTDLLNQRLLPAEFYALAEQHGAGFEPDVLALKSTPERESTDEAGEVSEAGRMGNGGAHSATAAGVLLAEPVVSVKAETDLEFYRRKQSVATVRHVSGDRLVSIIEVVSRGNKSGRKAFDDFVRKAAELLTRQIHLLIIDLQPATSRDPHGIHGAIWDDVAGEPYVRPVDKPLTLAAYESGASIRAFVEPVGVGDTLINMPLYLEPGRYVAVPLEETYRTAYDSVPRRWRSVLEA